MSVSIILESDLFIEFLRFMCLSPLLSEARALPLRLLPSLSLPSHSDDVEARCLPWRLSAN